MKNDSAKNPLVPRKILRQGEKLFTPDNPIIPFIIGDGIGHDIWAATKPVLDTATALAYENHRSLHWIEVQIGKKEQGLGETRLPPDTINAFREFAVGLKGPLSTPVGEGFRSLNVSLRRELDLYVCMRPIMWFPGSPSPVCHPERVNMVIFRENTEDIYTGIEFESESEHLQAFMTWLRSSYPDKYEKIRFPESSGIGIKPVSRQGSQRLVRAAIKYALSKNRRCLTLVHKGNIMKFTEGAFAKWGYDLAESEFKHQVFTQRQYQTLKENFGEDYANECQTKALKQGKLKINDVITDAAFEQTLTRPEDFDIIVTNNLNGDYLSDALSAQVGGLGIAPGVNLNIEENIAIFEATHGTAPTLAGKNIANPCSLILSGVMLLEHIGWLEASELVRRSLGAVLKEGILTLDFYRNMPGSTLVSTTDFGQAIIQKMHQQITLL
jgi:isocitrate dehydrogenase